ncbi:MAG: septation protein IspZ, partial [Gammaproteobacteria bacterium]|nr:septation protein IspZ [Gammaproteobacteria bacterium]
RIFWKKIKLYVDWIFHHHRNSQYHRCLQIFDTDTWVHFKVFGILSIALLFGIIQTLYLRKNATML